jgi:hypothetical protein
MFDVEPIASNKADCPCGCGGFGVLRKRTGHVKRCPCRRCEAGRYGRRAYVRERKIAKDVGGERQPLSGAMGGADVLAAGVCIEETAQKSICGPVRTAWRKKAARINERRHRYGETGALILTDELPWLVVTPYEDWIRR